MDFDFTPLFKLLANPNNLLIIFCLAVGYAVKSIPRFPTEYIRIVVIVVGTIAAPWFLKPIPLGLALGFIYGAVSTVIYDYVFSHIENWIFGKPASTVQVTKVVDQDMLQNLPTTEKIVINPPPQKP